MTKPDNRGANRLMTVFKAARIEADWADDLGLIRNISTEGLMVETRLTLSVEDPVVIEIQSGNRMAGTVRWARDGMTGIQLACPIDLAEALRSSGPADPAAADDADRIRPPRFERGVAATLQCEGRRWQAVTRNISLSGAQVVTDEALILPRNGHATLTIEGLGVLGSVLRWQRGTGIGVRFEHPLPLRHFQQWLYQVRDQRQPEAADDAALAARSSAR